VADDIACVLEWSKDIKQTEQLTILSLRCDDWACDIETFNVKIIIPNFSHILYANCKLDLQSRHKINCSISTLYENNYMKPSHYFNKHCLCKCSGLTSIRNKNTSNWSIFNRSGKIISRYGPLEEPLMLCRDAISPERSCNADTQHGEAMKSDKLEVAGRCVEQTDWQNYAVSV